MRIYKPGKRWSKSRIAEAPGSRRKNHDASRGKAARVARELEASYLYTADIADRRQLRFIDACYLLRNQERKYRLAKERARRRLVMPVERAMTVDRWRYGVTRAGFEAWQGRIKRRMRKSRAVVYLPGMWGYIQSKSTYSQKKFREYLGQRFKFLRT